MAIWHPAQVYSVSGRFSGAVSYIFSELRQVKWGTGAPGPAPASPALASHSFTRLHTAHLANDDDAFLMSCQGVPLSRALASAVAKGLTEPDPREDLNGVDHSMPQFERARLRGSPSFL